MRCGAFARVQLACLPSDLLLSAFLPSFLPSLCHDPYSSRGMPLETPVELGNHLTPIQRRGSRTRRRRRLGRKKAITICAINSSEDFHSRISSVSYEQDVSFLIHVFVNFYLINGGKRKRRKPTLAKRIREITNETTRKKCNPAATNSGY